jgi:hypothetical protein
MKKVNNSSSTPLLLYINHNISPQKIKNKNEGSHELVGYIGGCIDEKTTVQTDEMGYPCVSVFPFTLRSNKKKNLPFYLIPLYRVRAQLQGDLQKLTEEFHSLHFKFVSLV